MSKAILEEELAPLFANLPPLPEEFKNGFVKYVPIVTLVLLLISVPGLLAAFALGSALFAFAGFTGILTLLSFILSLVAVALTIFALPGLFKQKRSGWVLQYYSELVSIVASLLSISILGLVLNAVWLYVFFQVRDRYVNE
jgi:hypothetical protein